MKTQEVIREELALIRGKKRSLCYWQQIYAIRNSALMNVVEHSVPYTGYPGSTFSEVTHQMSQSSRMGAPPEEHQEGFCRCLRYCIRVASAFIDRECCQDVEK